MNQFVLAFLTGLTTGGISCFAVQGSLLTSAIASKEEIEISKEMKTKSLISFLVAKLIAYTLLGLLLGAIGSRLIISPRVQGFFQIFIGIYMLITAANLLNLHPVFRNFIIRPPKFIFKILRDQTKVKTFFTPILLGILTVFIPCGVTQGMMLLAVSSANPAIGALILFSFILGTIPVFFVIGLTAVELFRKKSFSIIAATVVGVLGIISINSGQVLRGSVHTLQNYYSVISGGNGSANSAQIKNGVQEVVIKITNGGYKTNVKNLKAGVPVKLILESENVVSCARAFTIPDLNYFKLLPTSGAETVEFTPEKLGRMTYTCSMGMYSGSFNIIE